MIHRPWQLLGLRSLRIKVLWIVSRQLRTTRKLRKLRRLCQRVPAVSRHIRRRLHRLGLGLFVVHRSEGWWRGGTLSGVVAASPAPEDECNGGKGDKGNGDANGGTDDVAEVLGRRGGWGRRLGLRDWDCGGAAGGDGAGAANAGDDARDDADAWRLGRGA